jgi:hypothetical protein
MIRLPGHATAGCQRWHGGFDGKSSAGEGSAINGLPSGHVDLTAQLSRSLRPRIYRITGIYRGVVRCDRSAMKRSLALVRRTPLPRRAELARRRRPIRAESDRAAALSWDAAAALDLVRDRDGCCVLCGGPGVMRITGCHAGVEAPHGTRRGSRCPVGLAVPRVSSLGGEPTHPGLRAWSAGSPWRHPMFRGPGVSSCRWGLLTDDGLVTPTDAPAAGSVRFAESWAAS